MSEQAFGHISLEINGRNNKDILKDEKVDPEIKRKIILIQKAKKFFYKYFEMDTTPIYEETTILDQEAVTYLVIHSRVDKIKAIKTSIPFVGNFPYLGFFKETSAKEFAKEKNEEGFVTFIRPVYAYSTLNHPAIPFYDNVLSSFFRYKDEDLIGTIFHELVHTVVFIDDEIQFNENLAQFISDELMKIYFKENPFYSTQKKLKLVKIQKLTTKIIELSRELNLEYAKDKKNYELTLSKFIKTKFNPQMKLLCAELEIKGKCWPFTGEWNNARFAALRTYESKRDTLTMAFEKSGLSLKDFLYKIIKLEKKHSGKKPFLEMLN